MSRAPAATAWKIALRSAQIVWPNDAFSTLQPANTRPSDVRTAAPTGNRLYGQYALTLAWCAAVASSCHSASVGIVLSAVATERQSNPTNQAASGAAALASRANIAAFCVARSIAAR